MRSHNDRRRLSIAAALTGGLLFAWSCRTANDDGSSWLKDGVSRPSQHVVHAEALRKIMGEIGRMELLDDSPQELAPSAERRRQARRLADVAGKLGEAAKQIPESLAGVRLPDNDRTRFVELAEQLAIQALELRQQAMNNPSADFSSLRDRIIATCNQCHNTFRILPAGARPGNLGDTAMRESLSDPTLPTPG